MNGFTNFSDNYESSGFKGAKCERDHEVGQTGTKCFREYEPKKALVN
jgi:hypothetical protein